MHLVQQQSRRTGSLQTYSGSKETSTMEELKKELEKLSKAYVDTPENEEKILIPFVKRLLELPMKERRNIMEWNYRRDFRRWKNIQENRSKEQMIPIYMFFFLGEENRSNDVGRNTDGCDMTV